ncbi:MAG: IS5 family transposase [Yaniella sp.]|uniref:IS5 family transposase n=1 Tax=Yaniella sp. TaxID=2773929 RepID=UPI00264989A6|nr:IS5 family transposase [Yaniella sp.]MDN6351551.1 IS5 family transposase [Yaniella sp.]MDN6411940.1 IS5 family transposase [Yaniella sp.]MDN6457333.1 IS5 family transposase [Yaniella sp.]MDN6498554.1 IS5 family transposase [Yaniella sp.]
MPAIPLFITDPLWSQFQALIPPVVDEHPLGCHRPRIPDRVVFDKLIQVLVLGASYEKISDTTCSATTMRRRRDEWITAGIFTALEQICLDSYDRIVGLELDDLCVDGCIVKAPCGGEIAGKSPVDRGKQGTKRSVMTDGAGIPVGVIAAPANRNDSPLLLPTLELLSRFNGHLPEQITVHLDAGYDSTKTRALLTALDCDWQISTKGEPLQAGARWVVERTNAWHTRGFKKLLINTERRATVNDAFIALANAIIIIRRLIREAWTTHRWEARPERKP